MKKYTMLDIAKAANVSKATVSYVLNEKSDARVSEQTRRKILQIANVYHYVPNLSAKYLGDKRKKLIGVAVGNGRDCVLPYDGLAIDSLYSVFPASDYKLVLMDSKSRYEYMDLAYDVIFAINLSEQQIREMSTNTFSPMVLLDCSFPDLLFFRIRNDYAAAFTLANSAFPVRRECVVLYCSQNNEGVNNILQSLPATEVFAINGNNRTETEKFLLRNADKNIVAIGEVAGLIALSGCTADRLAVISSHSGGLFPEGVIRLVWDENARRNYLTTIVSKLEAKEAEDSDVHELWVKPLFA